MLSGSSLRSTSTCSVVIGATLRFSTVGSFVPSHGFAITRRSRTAALKIEETIPCTTPTVDGASGPRSPSPALSRLTHAWTSLGRIEDNCLSPSVG